jgi:hypothetical protein
VRLQLFSEFISIMMCSKGRTQFEKAMTISASLFERSNTVSQFEEGGALAWGGPHVLDGYRTFVRR